MKIDEVIKRIIYFRNKKGYSARELSLMIGKNEAYINKLECLDFNLPTTVLLEIIEAFEISEEEFFSKNYQNYSVDNELAELLKSLPKDKKQHIIEFIKK